MKDIFKKRQLLLGLLFFGMCVALSVMLGELTLSSGKTFQDKATKRTQKSIVVNGQRGRILDRNGIPLAINEKSYDVEFYRDPDRRNDTDRALDTETIIKTIELVESNGGTTIDTFAVKKDEAGEMHFDFGVTSNEAVAARLKNWCDVMGFDPATITAADAYVRLRRTWQLPEELTYEEARKVMSIWQEVAMNQYQPYVPVKIAYNVSIETVAQVEQRSEELFGMSTTDSTVRIYPKGSLAAHVVGYMRPVDTLESPDKDRTKTTQLLQSMLDQGYAYSDLTGVVGVEATMEQYLTGNTKEHKGGQIVEVNTNAKVTRVLSSTQPTNGSDVQLTIDIGYQQKLEESLASTIENIKATQEQKMAEDASGYLETLTRARRTPSLDSIKTAQIGAAVVMEVSTGNVLALANYPSYDANVFTGSLSQADYQALFEDPSLPLFNKAIASKAAPGSIFKMATGLAGLMEGVVTVNTAIDDASPYQALDEDGKPRITTNAPSCWTAYPANHKDQDIVKALVNSCNYYFFTVADRLGIEKLDKWATKLGFNDRTNIELTGEARGQVGGQKVFYDNAKPYDDQMTQVPRLVYNQIRSRLKDYAESLPTYDADEYSIKLDECTEKLMKLIYEQSKTDLGPDIRRIMREELGIAEAINYEKRYYMAINSYLVQLKWNISQTVRTGIGQSVVLVTPIQVARYVSAFVNGGTVYDAHIVKSVVNPSGVTLLENQPSVFSELNADPLYLEKIKEGMKGVVGNDGAGGTAADAFKDYPEMYLKEIGSKTGTAQISLSKEQNIDIENTSWFVAFAPYEKPEIAIVVYVPNGLSGSSSAPLIQEIVKYHIDRQNNTAPENLVNVNSLTR